uniref:Uncharacterized protein n=1 Tax=Florenciella parvula TaxID=236787 RepID=A0A7S2BA99_9STRA
MAFDGGSVEAEAVLSEGQKVSGEGGDDGPLLLELGGATDNPISIHSLYSALVSEAVGIASHKGLSLAAAPLSANSGSPLVLSVPVATPDSARNFLVNVCLEQGLMVYGVVDDASAAYVAAMDAGILTDMLKNGSSQSQIMVVDLGGSLVQASLLSAGDGGGSLGGGSRVEVVQTVASRTTGSNQLHAALVDHLALQFALRNGIDLRQDYMSMERLHSAAEVAAEELSFRPKVKINLPFITADASGPKHLEESLTRAEYARILDDALGAMTQPIADVLAKAGVRPGSEPSELAGVLLVGAGARSPALQAAVQARVGAGVVTVVPPNPEEYVARGAAKAPEYGWLE